MLVAFEGIHCSGKSTIASLVADKMADFTQVIHVCEPTRDRVFGMRIRELAKQGKRLDGMEEWALFHADRTDLHREVVSNANELHLVISDRCYLSSIVYQGQRGVDRDVIHRESLKAVVSPDLVIFIDILPAEALRRHAVRGVKTFSLTGPDLLESLRVSRQDYLEGLELVAPIGKAVILEGERPIEDLVRDSVAAIKRSFFRGM